MLPFGLGVVPRLAIEGAYYADIVAFWVLALVDSTLLEMNFIRFSTKSQIYVV